MKKFLMFALVFGSFSLLGFDKATAAPSGVYMKPHMRAEPGATVRNSVRHYSRAPAPVPTIANEAGRSSVRSFSYMPSAAPAMRRPSPKRVPSYLLPKTDPRKYSGS